jgi:transketolase
MGILRTIPNMRVVMGADYWATRKLIRQAAEIEGPVYLRFTKGPIKPVYDEDVELTIGKANMLRDGKDIAIIANGDTVNIAVSAAAMLEEKGISARVLDMHTIKPLDVEAVTDCLVNIGKVITVEDAYIINGLGSAVSEVCAGMGKGIVKRIGVQDWFGQSGPYDKLLEINGITKEEIVKTAEALLG